jgi:hypothetical protein
VRRLVAGALGAVLALSACGSASQSARTRGTLCRAASTACAMVETYCAGAVPVDAGEPQN